MPDTGGTRSRGTTAVLCLGAEGSVTVGQRPRGNGEPTGRGRNPGVTLSPQGALRGHTRGRVEGRGPGVLSAMFAAISEISEIAGSHGRSMAVDRHDQCPGQRVGSNVE